MSQVNWSDWHRLYDDPGSRLSRRLRAVQQYVREAIERIRLFDFVGWCAASVRTTDRTSGGDLLL